jgi:hypothetical protein
MPQNKKFSKDIRKYSKQTTRQLILGGTILVLVVGTVLITVLIGKSAGISGFLCILIGLIPVVLTFGFFKIISLILRKYRD